MAGTTRRYFDCSAAEALEDFTMKTLLFAGAALALATTGVAQSQTPNTTRTQTNAPVVTSSGSEDIEFVLDAAQGGLAEVELGKLAAQRAQNDDVKKFAQRMVDDHSKANEQLQKIADSKSIKLPTEVDSKDKALMQRLEKLNGAAFDRTYMNAMVNDHAKDVTEFKREANAGRDPQVKSFAESTLPTLEEHLQQARTTRGTTSSTRTSSTAKSPAANANN
jgi:putative membrane protein